MRYRITVACQSVREVLVTANNECDAIELALEEREPDNGESYTVVSEGDGDEEVTRLRREE